MLLMADGSKSSAKKCSVSWMTVVMSAFPFFR